MAVVLEKHQLKAVLELDNGKILCGGVGVGKSHTAIAYYVRREHPKDLYIITTAKKRDSKDWEGVCAQFVLSRERSGSTGNVQVTVDSWNNLHKYKEITNAFFIFDEQRLVGSGTWTKSFIKISKKNRWILLSATPGDTWMDYIPVFVANGFYKNRTEFIRRHVVYNNFSKYPKIDHYVEAGRLVRLRQSLLVAMPYARATTRHSRLIPVQYDAERYKKVFEKRWNVFKERPVKEIAELFYTLRRVVNEDNSRRSAIVRLAAKHPRLIVFYNFDYELDILRTLGGELNIPIAEWNGHKHEEIPETPNWIYLVQYSAGSEGWNCVATDTVVFYSLNYSYRVMQQAEGRIDRMNTKYIDLYYYTLRSGATIDVGITKALTNKKNFNERDLHYGVA